MNKVVDIKELRKHKVIGRVIKQQEKGLKKYGNLVNPNGKALDEWIRHMQEELVDGHVYSEIVKQRLIEIRDKAKEALIALQQYDRHQYEHLLEDAMARLEEILLEFDYVEFDDE